MASDEAGLWKWLREGVLPLGHYSRIESPDTAPGFPDVDYIVEGRAGKMELKHSLGRTKIPFPNEDKGIHLSQKIWIRDAIRNGGRVLVVAEVGSEVLLIDGANAKFINGSTLDQLHELTGEVINLDIDTLADAAEIFRIML